MCGHLLTYAPMRHQKDYLRLIRRVAETPGWTVRQAKSNHYMIYPPDKSVSPYTASSSPSDHRSQRNLEAWLRRNGLRLRRKAA